MPLTRQSVRAGPNCAGDSDLDDFVEAAESNTQQAKRELKAAVDAVEAVGYPEKKKTAVQNQISARAATGTNSRSVQLAVTRAYANYGDVSYNVQSSTAPAVRRSMRHTIEEYQYEVSEESEAELNDFETSDEMMVIARRGHSSLPRFPLTRTVHASASSSFSLFHPSNPPLRPPPRQPVDQSAFKHPLTPWWHRCCNARCSWR